MDSTSDRGKSDTVLMLRTGVVWLCIKDQQSQLDMDFDCMEQQPVNICGVVSEVWSVARQKPQANTRLTISSCSGWKFATELQQPPPLGWENHLKRI